MDGGDVVTMMMGGGNENDQKKKSKDDSNPTSTIFHDFLGKMGSQEMPLETAAASHHLPPSPSHERQGVTSSEIFHFHGTKNTMSGSETSNALSGRKRNYSSSYMGLTRDRVLPTGSDSPESSRLMKMFGKEVVNERLGRSHDNDMPFGMQPPPRPTSSLILHPPVSSRPDSLISRWERSLPMNPGPGMHFPSRFGHSGTTMDRISSSYAHKEAGMGSILISQDAADEGSRTGKKGSGILSIINPSSSGAGDKNTTGMQPCNSRPKAQMIELESSNVPSHYNMAPSTRQMTIFYAGQAHVFDDVHPNKADVIMALAGSNGGSWSTSYSPKSGVCPLGVEAKGPHEENGMRANKFPLSIPGIPNHGFISQVAQNSHASDLPSLTPGADEGGRPVRDARLTIPAAETGGTDGKREANMCRTAQFS
ncbi:protein TIFY 8 [Iris pallida]|uniref:Protein TIFY n=1 Tax=Iris pallida TaxID=29817 RepID=A0AAX6I1I8_IRIPA|nr:protein TIFY 8 [Iris pallida]